MADTKHLDPRGRKWWYVRAWPERLRPFLPAPHTGKSNFRVNLNTSDLVLAQRKRLLVSADFERAVESARLRQQGKAEPLLTEAEQYRSYIQEAPDEEERVRRRMDVGTILEERMQIDARRNGEDLPNDDMTSRAWRIALDLKDWTDLDEHLHHFIAANPGKPHTNYKRRQVLEELKRWRSSLAIEAITPEVARQFVDEIIAPGAATATINDKVRKLSAYWKWMLRTDRIPKHIGNPWENKTRKQVRARPEDRKRPFTDAELLALLSAPPKRSDLVDMMLLGALTGARLEELATLRARHIDLAESRIEIPGTKTAAAHRTVPMHSDLVPLLTRRIVGKEANDWVFHELPNRKSTDLKSRSAPLSKAFTRYRRSVGVGAEKSEATTVDFHSFRRWLASKLVEHDTPEIIVERLCGWEGGKMRDRYTWSASLFRQAQEAITKVKLPTMSAAKI